MNASQFMDKQILGLAASAAPSAGGGGSVDLSDLMIPEDGEDRLRRRRSVGSANGTTDDLLPSYDFQPIRTTAAAAAAAAPQTSWGSLDSKAPSASASASYNLKLMFLSFYLFHLCGLVQFSLRYHQFHLLHRFPQSQLCQGMLTMPHLLSQLKACISSIKHHLFHSLRHPLAPPQQYQQPSQLPQYSQPSQPANVNPSTPLAPPQPEETMPYAPPQSYPPNARPAAPYMQLPTGPAPPYYGQNPSMYEPPAGRPNPGPPSSYGSGGYGSQGGSGFSESYGYSGSPSHRGNSGMKPSSPFASSGPSSGGNGNYGRLPTAQILPQAVPISSSSPTSGSSGSRVPLDDVVEKVATMGFSREQVRATVRRLTENGQNVDLNVVLDKLMNGR
ncbi:hypothetical protein PR202_ga23339 [Eleusine coracana subsp. coracana]|uniref:DUF1421 domain-containing protein n=1 Tax=Eleusine coracana subsp. coracana TaxID=191504 RepID=A0AAV5D5H0_ELECO|nr:hypothetical protein PR202_ga23339 [Eleusine coracana subsp. coracana]